MSTKNIDLSDNKAKLKEENLNDITNSILITTDNPTISNNQNFKPVENNQNNLPNVIDVKTTMLGVLGIFRNFRFNCHNYNIYIICYFYCI